MPSLPNWSDRDSGLRFVSRWWRQMSWSRYLSAAWHYAAVMWQVAGLVKHVGSLEGEMAKLRGDLYKVRIVHPVCHRTPRGFHQLRYAEPMRLCPVPGSARGRGCRA